MRTRKMDVVPELWEVLKEIKETNGLSSFLEAQEAAAKILRSGRLPFVLDRRAPLSVRSRSGSAGVERWIGHIIRVRYADNASSDGPLDEWVKQEGFRWLETVGELVRVTPAYLYLQSERAGPGASPGEDALHAVLRCAIVAWGMFDPEKSDESGGPPC